MLRSILAAAIVAVSLCACTYEVKTTAAPALNVYSSYGEKLAGKYALLVQSDIMTKTVEPSSNNCGPHDYPIDARAAFKQSAIQTFTQLVETVETVEKALTAAELTDGQYNGLIVVRAEEYDPRLTFIPGFWSAHASSTVDMSASLLVDGPNGRLLGTKASESRTVESEASGCGSGADSLARANSKAMAALLDRLAERFSNEPRLRTAALP